MRWQLGEEVYGFILLGEALLLDRVTHKAVGAAVYVIGAAGGIGQRAAAILSTGQLAAGGIIVALGLCIWALDGCLYSLL